MLRTNSKKARENIRNYIINNCDPESYDGSKKPETFEGVAAWILDKFHSEYYHRPEDFKYYHHNEQAAFQSWTQGMPIALNCDYYLNSAIADLGDILEETETERNKYSEEDAERMLTYLIYRELTAATR